MHLSRGIPGTHKIGPTLDGGQGLFIESWDSEFEGHRPFFRLLLEELWYASPEFLESCLDVLCSAFGIEFHGFWTAANVKVTLFVFFHAPPLEIHGF